MKQTHSIVAKLPDGIEIVGGIELLDSELGKTTADDVIEELRGGATIMLTFLPTPHKKVRM